ncbi:MAG: serine/threonine-protein kinase [Lentisphaeria bacterium]|nr:serine/threonine-protein kinase [Lentisphaeria bacterium]
MSLRRPQENLRLTCPCCEQKLDASGVTAFEEISCPSCSTTFLTPFRFGQYLLEEAIEEGQFSGVYRAQDLKLRREVAVKILFEEMAGDAHIIDLFLGAARRTAILNHINILPIYSCDCHDGLPYIVMEYMAGTCLYRGLYDLDHMLPVEDCVHYCDMAARGLDAAHREDVDHDGLRPTNVLWDGSGNIKICDFGMYDFKRACAEKMGLDWRAFLHCGYTSPEVLTGESQGGLSADIFGLGTTLYHLLTGRRPFSNRVDQRMDNLAALPPSPRQVRPDVPADISDYVMRMIAFAPADRPHAYREIISTFFKLQQGLPPPPKVGKTVVAKRKRPTGRPLRPTAAHARRRLNVAATRKVRRKGTLLPALAGLVLALVALGAGALIFLAARGRFATGQGTESDTGVMRDDAVEQQMVNRPSAFANRPVPPGLDFSKTNDQLRNYLTRLPPHLSRREVSRLLILEKLRPHLRQLVRSLPYEGAGVRLSDGRVVNLVLSDCDNQGLSGRDESGAETHVRWDQLSFRQYGLFLEYYTDKRVGRGILTADDRTALAGDYLMLALLWDWLKDDSRAVRFAKAAIETDPETGAKTRELLPYLPL